VDELVRAIAADNFIKMTAVNAREIAEYARTVHKTLPTATAALGRTLAAASMLGSAMKEEKASLTIRISGGGPIGSIIAVSDSSGNVRGYVQNAEVDLPLKADGKLDVGGAVGKNGTITVIRDLHMKDPYVGSTALVSGEIAEDLTKNLFESDQTPSACALGVLVDRDQSVLAAGGYIVQLMPGAPDELAEKLEDNVRAAGPVSEILRSGSVDDVVSAVLNGFSPRILERSDPAYHCRCSRDRVSRIVAGLGKDELADILEKGEPLEIICRFCGKAYSFSTPEIRELTEECHKEN